MYAPVSPDLQGPRAVPRPALRVLVVEDHPLFRELVSQGISEAPDIEVVGVFGSGLEALARGPELDADVALLDIELGEAASGIDVGLKLREHRPDMGIVLLSGHADPGILTALPEEQAAGWSYLLKDSVRDIDTLVDAIRGASEGGLVIDPQLTAKRDAKRDSRVAELTPRQLEILKLVASGLSNAAIAERLVLAPKSVENHINTLYARLGIDSGDRGVAARVQAARIYLNETA